MSDHAERPDRLTSGEIIRTRQYGDHHAGIHKGAVSGGEHFSEDLALDTAQAAAAERARRLANSILVGSFVCSLPVYDVENGGIVVSGVDEAKRVQGSVIWPYVGRPAYIVGSRPAKNTKFTQLLTATPSRDRNSTGYAFFSGTVFTQDFHQSQARGEALLEQPYTHEQVQDLMDTDTGEFTVTSGHPHSMNLRDHPYGTSLVLLPFDAVNLAKRFMTPHISLATNVSKRGMRMKGPFHKSYVDMESDSLTDINMETFDVFDGLGKLADRFGRQETLQSLHQQWLVRHGGELVL